MEDHHERKFRHIMYVIENVNIDRGGVKVDDDTCKREVGLNSHHMRCPLAKERCCGEPIWYKEDSSTTNRN